MKNYREITLGSDSIDYIRKHLSYGLTISKYILNLLNLDEGQVVTGLPEDTAIEKLYDFEHGGILASELKTMPIYRVQDKNGKYFTMQRVPRAFPFVLDTVNRFLKGGVSRLLILEDANAKSTDPVIQKYGSPIWTFQSEVYHLVFGIPSNEEIKSTINKSDSLWTLVGFMTSLPKEEHFPLKKEISLETIEMLAENTQKILVGAYDGEGFLIWQRE
jgi:hypothetical protein